MSILKFKILENQYIFALVYKYPLQNKTLAFALIKFLRGQDASTKIGFPCLYSFDFINYFILPCLPALRMQ